MAGQSTQELRVVVRSYTHLRTLRQEDCELILGYMSSNPASVNKTLSPKIPNKEKKQVTGARAKGPGWRGIRMLVITLGDTGRHMGVLT